jgi:hypothetical protein
MTKADTPIKAAKSKCAEVTGRRLHRQSMLGESEGRSGDLAREE